MSVVVAALAADTWLAIAAAMSAFLLLFATLEVCARKTAARPETTRKLLHVGSGVLTLAFPFLFRDAWPVLLLTGASAVLVASAKFVPAVRGRLGGVANRVGRTTLGELYFPLSVAVLFALTRGREPLQFVIPVLLLTLADAAGAMVGARYGLTPYAGATKTLEGSVAFAIVAFVCVHVPLLLWSGVGRAESLLAAATVALLLAVLEASASRGLDNLFIPLGGYVALRSVMGLDAGALQAGLAISLAFVLPIAMTRTGRDTARSATASCQVPGEASPKPPCWTAGDVRPTG